MRESHHRPGPAFDKAADFAEHERQRRIAALTDQQRQEHDALIQSHAKIENDSRHALDRQHGSQLRDRMRAHLTPEPQSHPKPRGLDRAPDDRQLKSMRHAVDDYLAGTKTRDTNAYALQLQQAEAKARGEFTDHMNAVLAKLHDDHQMQRDQFIDKCEKDRARQATKSGFNKSAENATWLRAIEKAAIHEAGYDRDCQLSKEFGKSR